MKGGFFRTPASYGFTIIEVMVFLAVSGFTFLIAAEFINGKAAQAEFNQGMNQAELQMRTIINNVSNGNYALPNGKSLGCAITASGPQVTPITSIANGVAVKGCTFFGSVLEPNYLGNPGDYYLYTVAGCQYYTGSFGTYNCSTNTTDPTPLNFQEEQPQTVSSLSRSQIWTGGVTLNKLYSVIGNSWNQISAIGFFDSFPTINNGILESGAVPVSIVYFSGSSSQTQQHIASLGTNSPAGQLLINGYVVMCFEGSKGHYGSINIGSNSGGQQLTAQEVLGQKVPTQCLS